MAFISSSSPPTPQDSQRLDIHSMRVLIFSVNKHMYRLLADPKTRKSLQQKCTSKLKMEKQEFFEFAEHSVLSNLYWGLESFEAAVQAKFPEEKNTRLKDSERMLQVPALLDEHGSTGGISNQFLVSCAYFYLSLVWKIQGDKWQMTLHFLQSLLVYPRQVRKEFATDLWEQLFLPQISALNWEVARQRGRQGELLDEFCEEEIDRATRRQARRYKDWLAYYRVVFYGETPGVLQRFMDPSTCNGELECYLYRKDVGTKHLDLIKQEDARLVFHHEVAHHLDPQRNTNEEKATTPKASIIYSKEQNILPVLDDGIYLPTKSGEVHYSDIKGSLGTKCLHDMLEESQSDTSFSMHSHISFSAEGSDSEAKVHDNENSGQTPTEKAAVLASKIGNWKPLSDHCISPPESIEISPTETIGYMLHEEAYEADTSYYFTSRSHSSVSNLNFSNLDLGDKDVNFRCIRNGDTHNQPPNRCCITPQGKEHGATTQESTVPDFRCIDHEALTPPERFFNFPQLSHHALSVRKKLDFSAGQKSFGKPYVMYEHYDHMEMQERFENAISALCSSEHLEEGENAILEISTIWERLKNQTEENCNLLPQVVIDQLLAVISTSEKEEVVRASISILSILILRNRYVVDDIKRKGLGFSSYATALKRNICEAASLIYLLNPSPSDIKTLELLPVLVEVICNSNHYKKGPISLPLTATEASMKMIEELVTAFDYGSENMHLEVIMSPQVLLGFVKVANSENLEERVSLAAILVKCMRSDGRCRKVLSQITPVAPIVHLLQSNEGRGRCIALEFLHEILHIPRSSAVGLLHQIQQVGSINIMHTLMACIQQVQPEHQLLAASLLLQLDMLEDPRARSMYREEALEVLLDSVASEECPTTQILSAAIISNIGGNYTWTGESYMVAWLVQKAGLASSCHRNMIRNYNGFDESIQDDTESWCHKIARSVTMIGSAIFHALEKGLQSKISKISRDCLIAVAWLGCAITAMGASCLQYSACEILLPRIVNFLHPGLDLEERLLACLCLYNYTSGKGMQKLMKFSEGQRDSLRRLSSITWMANELLKVIDYSLPSKSQLSCVHTQILEVGHSGSGAVSALIYYKGQLCGGYSDGSIKVWEINAKTAKLVWEDKGHKKHVTCFALYEPGNSLLSGSADKTVRIWKMVQRRLECIGAIEMEEPIRKIDAHGQLIFAITQSRGLKVCDASRIIKVICRSKQVQSLVVAGGKIYLGCTDLSIQAVDLITSQIREIGGPEKSWGMQKRSINSIVMYGGWVYSAGATVKASNMQEQRRQKNGSLSSTALARVSKVQAMAVVEDFIYLSSSSSPSILQIWLREKQQKVGRLSAGSKIMSLLTANDIVLCGTETGLIKGWIPL